MRILAEPEVVVKNGRPKAVILTLREYRRLLELAEDAYDRRALQTMRRKKGSFRTLEDYLKSRKTRA